MVEVDYNQLADFGGFDGHTPCLILFGIEAPGASRYESRACAFRTTC